MCEYVSPSFFFSSLRPESRIFVFLPFRFLSLFMSNLLERITLLTHAVSCAFRSMCCVATLQVSGSGTVAFTCHGDSLTFEASETNPVYTDPRATVAWSHDPTSEVSLVDRFLLDCTRSGRLDEFLNRSSLVYSQC